MENYLKGKDVEKVQNVQNFIRANLYKIKELNALISQDFYDALDYKNMTQAFWIHIIKEASLLETLRTLVHKIRVKRFREYMFMKKIRVLQQNARNK